MGGGESGPGEGGDKGKEKGGQARCFVGGGGRKKWRTGRSVL